MKEKFIQYVCSFILTIPCFLAAYTIVWPSYAMAVLQSDESPLGYKISENEASLISSSNMLTPMIASMFSGTLADKIGRKKTSIICTLILLLSWILVITAKSATQILIGRLIAGLGIGSYVIVVIVYISELCHNSTKGTAMSMVNFFFSVGCLVSYTLGWLCSYNFVCYFSIALCIVFEVLLISFMKETPVFFIGQGKEKEALSSLKFYRGTSNASQEIMDELSYMRSQHKQNKQDYVIIEKSPKSDEAEKLNEGSARLEPKQNAWKLILTSPSSRRALISQVMIMTLTVSMGMTCVQVYAAKLFIKMAPNLSSDFCSILLAIVFVISSCVGTLIMDLCKRRTLMISSTFISSWCMALIGSMLRWSWASDWMVTVFVVIFSFSYQVGPFNLPFVLTSESFGPQVKSVASQCVIAAMSIANFLQLLVFSPVVDHIGIDGTFFLFAGIGFFSTIYFYFTMMETKGKLLEEVQVMYEKGFLYRKE